MKGRGLKIPFILSLFWFNILFFIFDDDILQVFFPLLGPICKENLFSLKLHTCIDENASSIEENLSLFKD